MTTPNSKRRALGACLMLGWLALGSGCVYIEQINTSTGGQSFGPYAGRAYFIKRSVGGTKVLVCDVRPASAGVVCYESDRSSY